VRHPRGTCEREAEEMRLHEIPKRESKYSPVITWDPVVPEDESRHYRDESPKEG